jgi:uncharacterized protein
VDATPDDLTRPLGVERLPHRRARPVARLAALGGLLVATALIGIVALWPGRQAPAPFAVAPIRERDPAPAVPSIQEGAARRSAGEVETASGVAVVRAEGGAAPDAVVIRVPDQPVRLAPAPDTRLVERTRYGLLPKVGPDGARPAQIYARPLPGPAAGRSRPRISLLVGGLGISPTATAEAIARLPPAVTLAFAPYGSDLERLVARAREGGHEVMLQVPMEPFDYPDNDPGPHTLTVGAKPQENLDRLHWVMGRFTGYTGIVTYMGAKLTADEAALSPILREVGGRGLILVDDGSSSRSTIRTGVQGTTPTLRAHGVVDALPQPDAVDRELTRLEAAARERGAAVATASALPLTVDRIARWARGLDERGLDLVPVSALAEARR